jgi:hypothetical protein
MNKINFEDRVNPAEDIERTDQGENGPVADVDANSDTLENLAQAAPIGVGSVEPADEAVADEKPLDESIAANVPEADAIVHETVIGANAGSLAALLSHEESDHFRTLWTEIQGKFVDEPRSAVQQADALVSVVIEKITQMFASEHGALEEQWKEGKDVSTEDLRQALRHYRSFFKRLVV